MEHQDFKPVVIRGKSPYVPPEKQHRETFQKQTVDRQKNLDDIDGPPKVEMVSAKFKQDFINARTAAKKTQDQLAKEARNLKDGVKAIKALEAGKLTMKEAVQVAVSCRGVIGIIKR